MMFPTEKRELIFGAAVLCSALFLANCALFGSLNLGFAIGTCLCILCSVLYLRSRGCKPGLYAGALVVLSMVIAASFGRGDDIPVKVILTLMILVCLNLGLCLQAGKNRRDPGTAASLLDGLLTMCLLPFCHMGPAFRGIGGAYRSSSGFSKKGGSVLLGLAIALPLLIILVPLLMNADAAFEGFVDMLPSFSLGEFIVTILFGAGLAIFFYTRTVALKHADAEPTAVKIPKGLSSLTVNTVLVSVCVVYVAYLASQLAYFSGGFSGILPEEYTLAQYARRGFFEMAWLCALNLCIIVGALWVCVKKDPAPLSTRILCLFIGIVTLFLVATASAKMVLYIDSYGLTRLRVLTQVIMIFLGIVTLLVCLWLFIRKLPYMKAVILAAMLIGAAVSWMDVDTLVAGYNTDAYLSGKMEKVDVAYLGRLGDGAVPYLVRLHEEAPDSSVREAACAALLIRDHTTYRDFRGWNYASAAAEELLTPYRELVEAQNTGIIIHEDRSMLVDFYQEDGIVHMVCKIELENPSASTQKFNIVGYSAEDVNTGLLLQPKLIGYNEYNTELFVLEANSRVMVIVDFQGEYAGKLVKTDREIPNTIEIINIE